MATENVLSVVDYIVFVVFLLASAAIGVYHATCSGRQSTSSEYFLADRSMSAFPVSVSLAVSVVSAITTLGTPALCYVSGPAYWVNMFGRILSGIFTSLVICPVFYNLKITSIYEYMETRFNVTVRYITVFIHIVSTLLVLGVIVYAPALALNAVTGLSLYGSIIAVGLVCTFYSTIGGIKAVVWSDLFQVSLWDTILPPLMIICRAVAWAKSLGGQFITLSKRSTKWYAYR
ncbi:Sodium-coupled monocarboxylate transporter 1 [Holothuria leucospilota]|uniref:Sodium-coupled monocarboxylate transporter 1 n=1 Tax=Holothuria leucospilota TaxID=206669 RepID=A0A9Q1CHJ9_HOLLE|nr:Sodium-coupled monocarboxylate transporter 1 [Holothuria leucospilota]